MEEEPLAHQAAIARLPAELLTNIFHIIAEDPRYDAWNQYLPDTSIAISHVCAFWRNAALGPGGKSLWSHIPLRHNAACVHAFMERSQPLPVFLKIELGDTSTPSSPGALAEAVTYMDRVGKLAFRSLYDDELSETDMDLYETVYGLLELRAAPALESLVWSCVHIMGPEDEEYLPSNLFASEIPSNLRMLAVNYVDAYDHALLRANLTYFEMQECEAWATLDDVLESLSCMPNLEQLILRSDRLITDIDVPEYTQRSVDLPRLETFSISEVHSDFTNLFYYLRIPRTARIHFDFGLSAEDILMPEDMAMLRDAFKAHYGTYDASVGDEFALSTISIGHCGNNYHGLTLQASDPNFTYLSVSQTPQFPLTFDPSTSAAMIAAVRMLLDVPAILHATQLNISHSTFFAIRHSGAWSAICTYLPNVETIVISRAAFQGLCPALLASPDSEFGTAFPKLKGLFFEGIVFDDETNQAAFFLVALVRLIRHRLRIGHPIERVEFRKCFGAQELAQHLSTVLSRVGVEVCHKKGARSRASAEMEAARWDVGDADLV